MTSLRPEDVQCCICGEKNAVLMIDSTNTFGSPDLDTRPAEMMRSTLQYWVKRCSSCGYCASDLTEADENAREVVASKEYQAILANNDYPEVAASFLALSHQEQSQGTYVDAAWSAINAAWICDDEDKLDAATECRLKAISLIEQGRTQSQGLSEQVGASEVVVIDLMRRAGRFSEALHLIERLDTAELDEIIAQLIEYERFLIGQCDAAAHTVTEATDGRGD